MPGRLLDRHGPLLAAVLAAVAALPALSMPLISDDWGHLAAVADDFPARTPMGYFRPVTLASFWIELRAWGLTPSLFHLTNLLLIAGCAALVVVLLRRYTGDRLLAGSAGLLFALHPYHVENAAWVAARTDSLFACFFLCAALAYDRWRVRLRGLPIAALVMFVASLLAKETAVVFLVFIPLLGLLDRSRRATREEWARGYLSLGMVAFVHFAVVRPFMLGEPGLGVLQGFGLPWLKRLVVFGVATLLPAQTELIEEEPLLWGVVGLLCSSALVIAALARSGRIPRPTWAAALMFPVLLGPSLISFQERYLFLPGAASALALASLLQAAGRWLRIVVVVLLSTGWSLSLVDHWFDWLRAGRVSSRIVGDLVEAGGRPNVHEIIVANMPHRVGGAPVAGDFAAAISLTSGRRTAVHLAAYVDYATANDDALAGAPRIISDGPAPRADLKLRIPAQRYSRLVYPYPRRPGDLVQTGFATIMFGEGGEIDIRIPQVGKERAAYVWSDGRLQALF